VISLVRRKTWVAEKKEKLSQPISRVLSWTVIHLELASPQTSCGLPESSTSSTIRFLFGLAPNGVYIATNCYQSRGALLPHHFTLTPPPTPVTKVKKIALVAGVSGAAVYFLLHFP